jgi:hypothetical protein
MVSVIYTTYGVAMGHRPEALAESGGVRPAGVGGVRERPAVIAVSRGWWLLETLLVRVGLRQRDVVSRMDATAATEQLQRPPEAAVIAALTRTAPVSTGGD